MSFTTSTESLNGFSQFETYKFEERGQTLFFMMTGTGTRTSTQYGEFEVIEGVSFDPNAVGDGFKESIKLISFTSNTVLQNLVKFGKMRVNGLYKVVLEVPKDEKFENESGKIEKSKYNRFVTYPVSCNDEVKLQALLDACPKSFEEEAPFEHSVAKPRV